MITENEKSTYVSVSSGVPFEVLAYFPYYINDIPVGLRSTCPFSFDYCVICHSLTYEF